MADLVAARRHRGNAQPILGGQRGRAREANQKAYKKSPKKNCPSDPQKWSLGKSERSPH